jgi:hypothetical protein
MSTLTLQIYPEDCVGDSSAKHNYNSLVLDTNVCNLSSQFFLVDNNFNTVFTDFQNNLSNFINFANQFSNPEKYNLANATTNLLSSYWNQHEFSVHYPLNIFSLNNLSCPTINQPDNTLQSLANVFLNNNYPPTQFTTNTVANVVFFLYSVPVDPSNLNNLQTTITSPEFSYMVRNMNVSLIRQDIHFDNGKVFKFKNNGNGSWIYFRTDTGTALSSINNFVVVPPTPPANRITIPLQGTNARTIINLTVTDNVFNYDVYAAALNSGLYVAGYSDIYITINNQVTIGSTSPFLPALLVSSVSVTQKIGFVNGDTVSIINNGSIIGAGGVGGNGQDWGSTLSLVNDGGNGGDAMLLQFPTNVENNGTIAGGGGGGAGGYIGVALQNTFNPTSPISNLFAGGGGGGGAGTVAGNYGVGGTGFDNIAKVSSSVSGALLTNDLSIIKSGVLNGLNGNAGSAITGGLGGVGGNGAANGGSGGGLGINGTSTGPVEVFGGTSTQYPPKGGTAGNYINGKTYLNLLTEGLLYGNIV